jgi:hypothetical protein
MWWRWRIRRGRWHICAKTPAPIAFSSGTTVMSEDKVHVSVDVVLRTLAVPDWQNNLVPLLQQRAWDYRVFSVRRRFT